MLARLTQIDYDREMVFVPVIERKCNERAVGVSRYVADADGESREFALAVADEWHGHGHGLGTALMAVLLDHARTKGLRRMHGAVLAENRKMLALARQLGFVIKGNPEDALLLTVTLDVAAPPDVGAAHAKGASTSA